MTRRKHRPVRVERDACLRLLGLLGEEIEWDHSPPLALREKIYNKAGEFLRYDPDENDPRYIAPRLKADHRAKTIGKKHDVSDGDIHKIAKTKRLAEREMKFRARVLSGNTEKPEQKRRLIPSRPFPKRFL